MKLGKVLQASGSKAQALALFRKAAQEHPEDVQIHILLGELLESEKDWDGAKASYQKALEIQPENAVASNNLASVILQEGGNIDVALAMAQTARRGMPDSADAADKLGWAYYKKGAFGNAIDLFKEAVKKNPDDPSFHYHLGLAYQQAGNQALAKEQLQKVLKISPNFSEAENVKRALSELHS